MIGQNVYEKLVREIAAGKFAEDGRLPSESRLCDAFGVSRMTVRGALAELQRQGLIEKRNGAGSFLTHRALRKSGVIGLVIPNFESFEFFADIRDELERHCRRLNYSVRLVFTRERDHETAVRDIRRKVRELAVARAEGVIFRPYVDETFAAANQEVVRICQRTEIPVVLIDSDITRPPKRSDCDLVAVNNIDAGRLLAAHLLETGRRRIAFMTSGHPATANDNWRNRLFGLAGELSVLGANEGVRTLPFPSAGPNAVRKLMKGRAAPQAIVCGNDETAVRLIRRLKEAGYSVPEDVAVAGFDDADCARSSIPPLTTIHQPTETIARSALRLLLERIRLPKGEARTVYLATPLVRRHST